MAKTPWKGSAMLSPVPCVLVSCGSMDKPNVFTVGWTGIINSQPPKCYISVRPQRYSYELIKSSGEFAINFPKRSMTRAVDFCGVRSGRDTDKFAKCAFTPEKASAVCAPLIRECPISLECRVFDIIPLGTHDMFLCDIVAADVDENAVDSTGKLRMDWCELIAYSHGDYMSLGKKLGSFGLSVRRKKKKHT